MMKLPAKVLVSTLCVVLAHATFGAEGSIEEGQAKSTPCIACHGVNGASVNPEWPNLAGQHAPYILAQLEAFKSGERQDPLMTPMAQPLSQDDMADLAAYYTRQTPPGLEAEPSKVSLGQRIYRSGDPETGTAACGACHGPTGLGNPTARYPRVSGQHATYIAKQLRAYRDGSRDTDPNQMMRDVARLMTDEQIEAVASYIQGLR